jgi:hypothetical protein
MTTEPITPVAADRRPGDPLSVLLTRAEASLAVLKTLGPANRTATLRRQ